MLGQVGCRNWAPLADRRSLAERHAPHHPQARILPQLTGGLRHSNLPPHGVSITYRMYGKSQANWVPAERGELRDFLDFTVANARRANAHALAGAIYQRAHRLQVEVPAPFRNVMSVADLIAECRLPATYFANLCHETEISYVNRILSIARGACFSLPRRSEIALRRVSAPQEQASRRNRGSFFAFRARRHAAAKPERASSARLTR